MAGLIVARFKAEKIHKAFNGKAPEHNIEAEVSTFPAVMFPING